MFSACRQGAQEMSTLSYEAPRYGCVCRAVPPGRAEAEQAPKPAAKKPRRVIRSDAVTLLDALQREARFVDFVQEPLADYSDAQIGAVARDVHRDCGRVLERLFALRPIEQREDGAEMEVPAGFDAGRYRLTGNVTGEPFVAMDLVGAGEGELVVVSQGSSARAATGQSSSPVDAAIVGILDSLWVEGAITFRKE